MSAWNTVTVKKHPKHIHTIYKFGQHISVQVYVIYCSIVSVYYVSSLLFCIEQLKNRSLRKKLAIDVMTYFHVSEEKDTSASTSLSDSEEHIILFIFYFLYNLYSPKRKHTL